MRATFRTAAVAAGAVTALALPAAHAFAADTPAPSPSASASPSQKKEVKRERVGGPTFDKGWSGKVYDLVEYVDGVRTSNLGFEADVFKDGVRKGSLKGHDGKGMAKTVTRKVDGVTFTLTFNGDLTAKGLQEGAGQRGRTLVKTYENLGGSGFDARVYRTGAGHEADILNGKAVWHTLKTDGGKADTAQHNGARFVLDPDGTLRGWTEGAPAKPNDGDKDRTVTAKPTPKGGVKAGAEGVDTTSPGLIAGGAGLAAAGAAGLGFALLRHNRSPRP